MRIATIAACVATLACSLPAAAETYVVDNDHSSIVWGIQHLGLGNTYGRFNTITGTIVFDQNDLANSSVDLAVEVGSIDSASKKRDDHLRNPDFFDAGTHPTITFTATGLQAVEGQEGRYIAPGKLTIRGTTKDVEMPVTLVGTGTHPMAKKPAIGFEGEFTLDRTGYGVGQGEVSKFVGKDVRMIVAIEAIAK